MDVSDVIDISKRILRNPHIFTILHSQIVDIPIEQWQKEIL